MAYTALARTWRPKTFAELVGQEHVRRALMNALESGRVHHAFLFTGTRGVGKTTIARIFAKCLNCETGVTAKPCGVCGACREIDTGRFVDLIEVDAASRTKVDDTREMLDNVQYAPTRGRYKVYLIDEVHMLSTHSFNALLKTFEEPPPHVKFLLATTDPQKVPVTVLSRCLQFNLKRLPVAQITERMREILEKEGVEFEAAGLRLVAQAADGSMRDGLSLLDQLIAFGGGKAGEEEARAMLGTLARDHVVRLADLLGTMNVPELLTCAQSLEEFAPDYAQVLDELASLFVRIAMKQAVSDFEGDELYAPEVLERLAKAIAPEDVQLFYQTAITGRRDLGLAPDPRAGFEMTLLRMIAFRPLGEAELPRGPALATGSSGAGGGAAAARAAAGGAAGGRLAGGSAGAAASAAVGSAGGPSIGAASGSVGAAHGTSGGSAAGMGAGGAAGFGVGGTASGMPAMSGAAAARAAAAAAARGGSAAVAARGNSPRGGAPAGGSPEAAETGVSSGSSSAVGGSSGVSSAGASGSGSGTSGIGGGAGASGSRGVSSGMGSAEPGGPGGAGSGSGGAGASGSRGVSSGMGSAESGGPGGAGSGSGGPGASGSRGVSSGMGNAEAGGSGGAGSGGGSSGIGGPGASGSGSGASVIGSAGASNPGGSRGAAAASSGPSASRANSLPTGTTGTAATGTASGTGGNTARGGSVALNGGPAGGFSATAERRPAANDPGGAAVTQGGGGGNATDSANAGTAAGSAQAIARGDAAGSNVSEPWADIVGRLELGGAARQLASNCLLMGRQGAVVRLALDARNKHMRTPAQEDKLTQALSRYFGQPVRLEFELAATGVETPAQAEQRASMEDLDAARRAFESDPGVQGLRERFGATLLPDTIRPVK